MSIRALCKPLLALLLLPVFFQQDPSYANSKCTSTQLFAIHSQQGVVNTYQQNVNMANNDLTRANAAVTSANAKVASWNSQISYLLVQISTAQANASRNAKFPTIQSGYLKTVSTLQNQMASIQPWLRMDQQALSQTLRTQANAQNWLSNQMASLATQSALLATVSKRCMP